MNPPPDKDPCFYGRAHAGPMLLRLFCGKSVEPEAGARVISQLKRLVLLDCSDNEPLGVMVNSDSKINTVRVTSVQDQFSPVKQLPSIIDNIKRKERR